MTSSSNDVSRQHIHVDSGRASRSAGLSQVDDSAASASSHDSAAATHTRRDNDWDGEPPPSCLQRPPAQNEFVYAMKEDLGDWLSALYGVVIVADEFFDKLDTGVLLCRHANAVHGRLRSTTTGDTRSECKLLYFPRYARLL